MSHQYGIRHTPLTATICQNKRDPKKAVAFIGNQICFLEHNSIVPKFGETVEVMITRAIYHRHPAGHKYEGGYNWNSLMALGIEVIDPDKHLLIAINGFECAGTMCRTTAYGYVTNGSHPLLSDDIYDRKDKTMSLDERIGLGKIKSIWLTPGRCGIVVANNVNVGWNGNKAKPRTPTNVWVEKSIYEEKSGCGVRVAGLTRIEDGEWTRLVR